MNLTKRMPVTNFNNYDGQLDTMHEINQSACLLQISIGLMNGIRSDTRIYVNNMTVGTRTNKMNCKRDIGSKVSSNFRYISLMICCLIVLNGKLRLMWGKTFHTLTTQ